MHQKVIFRCLSIIVNLRFPKRVSNASKSDFEVVVNTLPWEDWGGAGSGFAIVSQMKFQKMFTYPQKNVHIPWPLFFGFLGSKNHFYDAHFGIHRFARLTLVFWIFLKQISFLRCPPVCAIVFFFQKFLATRNFLNAIQESSSALDLFCALDVFGP